MFSLMPKETVAVLRAPLVRDHGVTVQDWESPSVNFVEGCLVEPGATVEDNENRAGVSIAFTVYMPDGSDINATDRIRLPSGDYSVVGEPERWKSPTGLLSHVKVLLQRWAD